MSRNCVNALNNDFSRTVGEGSIGNLIRVGSVISFDSLSIEIAGQACFGQKKVMDGPGSFTLPFHRSNNVWVGWATRINSLGMNLGRRPVMVRFDHKRGMLHVRTNDILSKFLMACSFARVSCV